MRTPHISHVVGLAQPLARSVAPRRPSVPGYSWSSFPRPWWSQRPRPSRPSRRRVSSGEESSPRVSSSLSAPPGRPRRRTRRPRPTPGRVAARLRTHPPNRLRARRPSRSAGPLATAERCATRSERQRPWQSDGRWGSVARQQGSSAGRLRVGLAHRQVDGAPVLLCRSPGRRPGVGYALENGWGRRRLVAGKVWRFVTGQPERGESDNREAEHCSRSVCERGGAESHSQLPP